VGEAELAGSFDNASLRVYGADDRLPQPNTLYTGDWNNRVLKSVDGGTTWSVLHPGLARGGGDCFDSFYETSGIASVTIDLQNPSTLYATASDVVGCVDLCRGIFKSTDGGKAWIKLEVPNSPGDFGACLLAMDTQDPATLYAGGGYGGIFKSTDGGTTWSAVNSTGLTSGLYPRSPLAIDSKNPRLYLATVGGGLFEITLSPQDVVGQRPRRRP
jgi:hypothetical protein